MSLPFINTPPPPRLLAVLFLVITALPDISNLPPPM